MKKIWLLGGFGNVLFQILAYRVIKKEKGNNVFYVEKLTEKNIITKLIKWSTHQKLYSDLIQSYEIKKVNILPAFLVVFLATISKRTGKFFSLSSFYSSKLFLDEKKKLADNIFGYFQEKEFLSKNLEELHKLGDDLKNKYGNSEKIPIVVHFRKGDTGWPDDRRLYYEKVRELLKEENGNIIIVTDSKDDAMEFFSELKNFEISNSTNALDDFKIMLSANKLYCAPSTFSWWAAHALDDKSEILAPQSLQTDLGMYIRGTLNII